jgi:hypothetical protein
MEGIFAVIFIFGGATAIGFSFTPLGRAIADRIRHGAVPPANEPDPAVYDELNHIRQDMAELQERVDFTERLLADREAPRELRS